METLKFLMTTDTYPPYSNGGDANHVFLLSHELADKGHEVHVVSNLDAYSLLSKRYNWKPNRPEKNGTRVSTSFLNSPRGGLEPLLTYVFGASRFYSREYERILDRVRPDVVHHHDVTFLGHDFFKRRGDYKQLYTAHNYWLVCPNRESFRFGKVCQEPSFCSLCLLCSGRMPQVWRWRKSGSDITRDIDAIIAPSEYVKQRLGSRLNKRIICLPNFIPASGEGIRPPGYADYFLYVGQLEERKGIMNLLETFRNRSSEINASLIIVGSGSLEPGINLFIKKNRMEKKVLLLGRVDREMLWSLYSGALALVVPSVWPENNPLVALEALSAGTPVIGTDAGGLGEIIRKVDEKLIFRGDGFEEIRTILEDKGSYPRDRIKEIFARWYLPERYLAEYEKLLEQI